MIHWSLSLIHIFTLAPHAKKPNTIGGVVQGTVKNATGQNPITVNTYPIMIVTNGATTNVIPKIGFNTMGIPNVTVSLMLNKPGTNDNVAIALLSSRLPKIMIAITKPIVTPDVYKRQ